MIISVYQGSVDYKVFALVVKVLLVVFNKIKKNDYLAVIPYLQAIQR
jgi:hypothetical protein